MDDAFRKLVAEVLEVRKPHATCLSAQDDVSMKEMLEKIVNDNVYKNDYKSITSGLLFEEVDCNTVLTAVQRIIGSNAFED